MAVKYSTVLAATIFGGLLLAIVSLTWPRTDELDAIPEVVWAGSNALALELEVPEGTTLTLWAETTGVSVADDAHKTLEVSEELPAGISQKVLRFPEHVGGSLTLKAKAHAAGDKLSLGLRRGSTLVWANDVTATQADEALELRVTLGDFASVQVIQ